MRKGEYGYVGSIEKALCGGGATQEESVNPTSEPQSTIPKPPFSLHTILCSQTEHWTFRNGKHLIWVPTASSWPAWDVDLCIPFPKPMTCLSIYTGPPPRLRNLGLIGENVHCCWAKKEPNRKCSHSVVCLYMFYARLTWQCEQESSNSVCPSAKWFLTPEITTTSLNSFTFSSESILIIWDGIIALSSPIRTNRQIAPVPQQLAFPSEKQN